MALISSMQNISKLGNLKEWMYVELSRQSGFPVLYIFRHLYNVYIMKKFVTLTRVRLVLVPPPTAAVS